MLPADEPEQPGGGREDEAERKARMQALDLALQEQAERERRCAALDAALDMASEGSDH